MTTLLLELLKLQEKVDKIEARQYAYDQHDPECAAFVHSSLDPEWNHPGPCSCWLVTE